VNGAQVSLSRYWEVHDVGRLRMKAAFTSTSDSSPAGVVGPLPARLMIANLVRWRCVFRRAPDEFEVHGDEFT
jgi:hypothetical protein